MNVRGALFDGIQQDFVHEAHDRSVFDVITPQRFPIRVFVAAGDFQIFEIKVIVGEAGHHRLGLVDGLCDRGLQLVVLDDHELDTHRGLETDLIQRVKIGRIGNRQE